MKKTWLLLPIAASQCVMPLVSCGPTEKLDEYEILLRSYRKMLLETIDTSAYKDKTPDQIIETLDIEHETKFEKEFDAYYFNDIDYKSGDKAIWPAHQHIVRTLQIAIIAYKKNNKKLMDIANRLTGYWLCHDFVNENWWFNMIGVPRDFSNLALFVIKNLPLDQQQAMMEWIHHGSLKYNSETLTQTGTNMFWVGDITMKSSLLAKDDEELNIMFEKVADEIAVDKNEGFQSDGSYFQHGHQLYTGGYGRQGALLLARIASAFVGSKFELDEDKIKIVVDFILDGIKYFTFKKNFNWQCMGRTIVRKQAAQYDGGTTDLGNIDEFRYIAKLSNCPRKQELLNLLDDWKQKRPTFEGVRYFDKSRFLASCIDGIYIGFKGTKSDLINSEIANNENLLSHNLTFGVNTCIMETGDEYTDITPIWNYYRIPGTTTYPEDDTDLLKYDNDSFKLQKDGTFYGGYDEKEGVGFVSQNTWHKLLKDKTSYTVTGFATPYGMAILGTDISNNSSKDKPLKTTVQQCLRGEQKLEFLSGHKGIVHGNVVYYNIEDDSDSQLEKEVEFESESWNRNNQSYGDEKREDNVLTIMIKKTTNLDKYAYSIQSNKKYSIGKFAVAKNDSDAQAVLMPNGKIACIFYNDNIKFVYKNITCSGNKGEFKIFE